MPDALAPAVAQAFDGLPPAYDAEVGPNPVGLYFRHVVQERLRPLFSPGARVLDLGCGTGEDAFFLASQGVDVHGIDVSPAMIDKAREKAENRAAPRGSVQFEVRAAEDLDSMEGVFDGAYSNFGALNGTSLSAVGRALRSRLRPGAPLALCVIGSRPFPGRAEEALTGRPVRSPEARVGGRSVAAPGLSWIDLREGLGPGFSWGSYAALGVLVPAPCHADWARRNPIAFGLLAGAERVVREWPVARDYGHHLLAFGARD
jgi:SAM-dependent methyltransferase